MKDLFYLAILTAIAYGLGRRVIAFVIKQFESKIEEFIFSIGIGLAALSYIVYALGSFGLLYLRHIILILIVCLALAIKPFYGFISRLSFKKTGIFLKQLDLFDKFICASLLLIALICLIGASAPVTGNDALSYHLYHPRVFIENHKIAYIPFTRESLWPYLTEMFFTLALIVKAAPLATMVHYLFGLLSALAVFSFTRRFFSKKAALLAAGLFYSAPGIFMQSVYAYIDLSQCFYSLIAFYALALWNEKENKKFLILSGIFSGLALSVKFLSGISLIALNILILWIYAQRKRGKGSLFKSVLIFNLTALLIGCIWYIRSYIVLGNPVYPFLDNIFKIGWDSKIGANLGTSRNIIGFLRLPWDLVMHLDKFGGEQIGVIFLAFLPCVSFLPFKKNIVKLLLIFLFFYAAIWFWLNPNVRFAFVGYAIAYILIAIGINKLWEKYNSSPLKIILCFCILFNAALCLYYNRDACKFAFAGMEEDDYLSRNERTYPLAKFINDKLPLNSVIIMVGEVRGFYFQRRLVDFALWKEIKKTGLRECVEQSRSGNIPVYVLYRNDAEAAEIKEMVDGLLPLYESSRRVDKKKTARYLLYKI